MKQKVLLLVSFITTVLAAQPELDIKPNKIEFEDLFNRIDHVYLINKGNAVLTIDSIDYNRSDYILDFEENQQIPFTILPNDSVKMNVTLVGFYYITSSDTTDTLFVYNNGINNVEELKVEIEFYEDDFGFVVGTVRDSLTPLDSTSIYFFYNGIYLIDKAITDASGNYQIELPEGDYTIAAERNGYYVLFKDSTYDPFFAELIEIDDDDTLTVNFNMKRITNFTNSVSGQVFDSTNTINIDKGIIIVRTGTHVPSPLSKGNQFLTDTLNAFAGFVKPDGSYTVYAELSSYYFLQAYTNNFLPGYYNDEGVASVFWQNADSIYINGGVTDKNISLVRDSSYGNGTIQGSINFTSFSDQINYEGITLLARNINTNALYSYNFGKEQANYSIYNIPYGTYEIVAQKIGFDNAFSQIVTIDSLNVIAGGINITFIIDDISDDVQISKDYFLHQNYPNPFNPTTNISFYLPSTSYVRLKVINILGETISNLIDDELSSGLHSVVFDGKGLSSGIYFVILDANHFRQSRKMLLLK